MMAGTGFQKQQAPMWIFRVSNNILRKRWHFSFTKKKLATVQTDTKAHGRVRLEESTCLRDWGPGEVLSQQSGGQQVPKPGCCQKEGRRNRSWVCFPQIHFLPSLCPALSHLVSQTLGQLATFGQWILVPGPQKAQSPSLSPSDPCQGPVAASCHC